jgi:zinc transport system permease protein
MSFLEVFWPAVAAAVVVGASTPAIGAFVVQKQLSLLGDGIGHMAFAGVAIGLWLSISPLAGALGAAIVGALGIELRRRRNPEEAHLVLALYFYGSIALAIVVASKTGNFNVRLFGFLFGQILTVTTSELVTIGVLGACVAIAVLALYRGLVATAIDEEAATVAGVRVGALNALLMILAATAIGVGMQVVGILLVAALMVVPVGVARNVARGFRNVVIGSAVVGATGAFAGLMASNAFDTAPSGTIVLVLIAAYILSAFAGRARELRARRAT